MNIEKLKDIANEYLYRAQALKVLENDLIPLIIIIDENDDIKTCTVQLETDEDEKGLLELIAELSKTAQAIILVIDSYIIDLPEGTEKPEHIKDHPDARNVLLCYVYTKEQTLIHRLTYIYDYERYTFSDLNWDDIIENYGNYKNPYSLENQAS